MANALTKEITNDMKTSIIKVFSFEKLNIQGTLSNPHFENEINFLNLTQLLLMINELLAELSYPQAVTEQRNFGRNGRMRNNELTLLNSKEVTTIGSGKKPLASFAVTSLFRQAASWQGRIKCIETGEEKDFISDLELLRFMLNILEGKNINEEV